MSWSLTRLNKTFEFIVAFTKFYYSDVVCWRMPKPSVELRCSWGRKVTWRHWAMQIRFISQLKVFYVTLIFNLKILSSATSSYKYARWHFLLHPPSRPSLKSHNLNFIKNHVSSGDGNVCRKGKTRGKYFNQKNSEYDEVKLQICINDMNMNRKPSHVCVARMTKALIRDGKNL